MWPRFRFDSVELTEHGRNLLDKVGVALSDPRLADVHIEIGVHTNFVGSTMYNETLTGTRAKRIREYLIEHYAIAAGRLSARGYGDSRPLTGARDAKSRAINRRVEFKVVL